MCICSYWFLLYHSMAFQNNKIPEQFLNDLFRNLSQFPIWQPMAEIGWTAECGKKLPDKKCRKKLYFPSSIILEKTGLDSENHVRSSSCWRPSFIVIQLKLLATIRMIKTRETYRTLKILPRHVKSGRTCEFRSRFRVNSSIFFRYWWIQEFFKVLKSTWEFLIFLPITTQIYNLDLLTELDWDWSKDGKFSDIF